MRTREEIEGEIAAIHGSKLRTIAEKSRIESPAAILEVLLDIRDLLANPIMQSDENGVISYLTITHTEKEI